MTSTVRMDIDSLTLAVSSSAVSLKGSLKQANVPQQTETFYRCGDVGDLPKGLFNWPEVYFTAVWNGQLLFSKRSPHYIHISTELLESLEQIEKAVRREELKSAEQQSTLSSTTTAASSSTSFPSTVVLPLGGCARLEQKEQNESAQQPSADEDQAIDLSSQQPSPANTQQQYSVSLCHSVGSGKYYLCLFQLADDRSGQETLSKLRAVERVASSTQDVDELLHAALNDWQLNFPSTDSWEVDEFLQCFRLYLSPSYTTRETAELPTNMADSISSSSSSSSSLAATAFTAASSPSSSALRSQSQQSLVAESKEEKKEDNHGYTIPVDELRRQLQPFNNYVPLLIDDVAQLNVEGAYAIASEVQAIILVVNDVEHAAALSLLKPVSTEHYTPKNTHYSVRFTGDPTRVRYVMQAPSDQYMAPVLAYVGVYGAHLVAIVKAATQGSLSATGSSNTLISAICGFLPRVVINVGVMYGVKEEVRKAEGVRFGDVVVCNKLYGYEHLKIDKTGEITIRASIPQPGNAILVAFDGRKNEFIRSTPNPAFSKASEIDQLARVHVGPVLSASVLMNNDVEKKRVLSLFRGFEQPKGGEMEGMGVHIAASLTFVSQWIIVKDISDWGDGTKDEEVDWPPFAAHAAAKFVYTVLSDPSLLNDWPDKLRPKSEEAQKRIGEMQDELKKAGAVRQLQETSAGTRAALLLPPVASSNQVGSALAYLIEQATVRRNEVCPRCGQNTFLRHSGLRVLTTALMNDHGECQNAACNYNPGAEFRDRSTRQGLFAPDFNAPLGETDIQLLCIMFKCGVVW